MSAIVDQTLDAEVQPLEHAEVANMYQKLPGKVWSSTEPRVSQQLIS